MTDQNQTILDLTELAMTALTDQADPAVVNLVLELGINKAEWLDDAIALHATNVVARAEMVEKAALDAGQPIPDGGVALKAITFAAAYRALNRARNAADEALSE